MNRILELRKSARLSQEDVAKFVGCSQMAISHYEKGTRKIPPEVISKLCSAFNVTADYLLGLSDTNTKSPAAQSSEANSDAVLTPPLSEGEFRRVLEMNTVFLQLDDAGKAQILAHAKYLARQLSADPASQD